MALNSRYLYITLYFCVVLFLLEFKRLVTLLRDLVPKLYLGHVHGTYCLWQTILTYLMKVIILTNISTLLYEL